MISEITPHHEEKGAQNNACIRLELSYSYRNHADRTDHIVYDLSNCPIPDYPNCLETAQSCVHNSSF